MVDKKFELLKLEYENAKSITAYALAFWIGIAISFSPTTQPASWVPQGVLFLVGETSGRVLKLVGGLFSLCFMAWGLNAMLHKYDELRRYLRKK